MTADRPPLFDFRTAQMRQARAKAMAGDTFLAQGAIEGLADRLATVTRRFENGLWIGEGLPQTECPAHRDCPGAASKGAEHGRTNLHTRQRKS